MKFCPSALNVIVPVIVCVCVFSITYLLIPHWIGFKFSLIVQEKHSGSFTFSSKSQTSTRYLERSCRILPGPLNLRDVFKSVCQRESVTGTVTVEVSCHPPVLILIMCVCVLTRLASGRSRSSNTRRPECWCRGSGRAPSWVGPNQIHKEPRGWKTQRVWVSTCTSTYRETDWRSRRTAAELTTRNK